MERLRSRKENGACEERVVKNKWIDCQKESTVQEFSGRDAMKRWNISPIVSEVVPVLRAPLRPWDRGSSLGRVFQLHLAVVSINQRYMSFTVCGTAAGNFKSQKPLSYLLCNLQSMLPRNILSNSWFVHPPIPTKKKRWIHFGKQLLLETIKNKSATW